MGVCVAVDGGLSWDRGGGGMGPEMYNRLRVLDAYETASTGVGASLNWRGNNNRNGGAGDIHYN